MNRIKDFIYNKNDIIIAILIVAIALFVILWRLDVILQYPAQILGTGDNTTDISDVVDDPVVTDDPTDDPVVTDPVDDPQDEPPVVEEPTSLFDEEGKLTKDVKVDVSGNTAKAAVDCLIKKGIFESYDEYKKCCKDQGLDDEKVKGGDFKFKKGATKNEIAKTVNWS